MTERDLKKLNRSDLLEMLLSLSRENELLRKDVEVLQAQLNDRMMTIENAASIEKIISSSRSPRLELSYAK